MLTIFDKLFWLRAGLGAVTGVLAQFIFGGDYYNGVVLGLLVYLLTYYFARYVWGKNVTRQEMAKLYTSGIGTFVMLYLFFWFLLFTLGVQSLALALSFSSLPI